MGWAGDLRRELSVRGRQIALTNGSVHETTAADVPSVIFGCNESRQHGNFYPASYRNICAHPEWARRLAMEGARLREQLRRTAHEYLLLPEHGRELCPIIFPNDIVSLKTGNLKF
jgi:hypothetical protein